MDQRYRNHDLDKDPDNNTNSEERVTISIHNLRNGRANHVNQEEMATLTVIDGTIELKDQLKDYKFRGEELTCMSLLEFMLETYEDSKDTKKEDIGSSDLPDNELPRSRGPGRPLSTRIPYQDEAGKGKRCRIKRSHGHETLPRIVGKWFCRSDNESEQDLFRGSMLMLLKPWRNLTELKNPTETFEDAYNTFISQANEKSRRVVANVQYYYECLDGAKAERRKTSPRTDQTWPDDINKGNIDIEVDDEEEIEDIYEAVTSEPKAITDDDIERARIMKTLARDRLYAESAVALGYDFGIFDEPDGSTKFTIAARKMQDDEGDRIRTWEAQLRATTREQINKFGVTDITGELNKPRLSMNLVKPAVATITDMLPREEQMSAGHNAQGHTERVELVRLNEDQRRAHDIVEERLKKHITGPS